MNKDCRVWGSRPVAGRDWGTSETCDPDLVAEYTELLEMRSDETEGMSSSFDYLILALIFSLNSQNQSVLTRRTCRAAPLILRLIYSLSVMLIRL